MTAAKVTVLGCGNSTGVPAIGNHWGACDPQEPRNNRSRSSIAVQTDKTTIIIDTGPDFRTQLTREKISRLDAVFYTHAHSDHVNGIDELRVMHFRNKSLIPVYADQATMDDLKIRFDYMFAGGTMDLYPPILDPHILTPKHFGKLHHFADIAYTPFEQDHGSCKSVGYRFGDFAYSVDIFNLDAQAIETLRGIKTWIVDAAAYNQENNAVHANFKTIYRLNEQIGAKQVYITSLTLGMDYKSMLGELREGYLPAHDGLNLNIEI